MKPLDLSSDAKWKQRFRAPIIRSTQLAARNPERGLAITNLSGVYQLHGWDVSTGDLKQLTHDPTGVMLGGINTDGTYIYHLQDENGNELGHYVRTPFERGEPEDITPDLPRYNSFSISESLNGQFVGFTAVYDGIFHMYTMRQYDDKSLDAPQLLYKSKRLSLGPLLSYDGDYAVISSTERSDYFEFSLLGFKVDTPNEVLRDLIDETASIEPVAFAPISGDTRILASTNASGYERPVIWDVKTGDRIDIPLVEMDGEVRPWAWSSDASKILLNQVYQAQYKLYVYDLDKSTLTKLNHPDGAFDAGYFAENDTEIWISWHQSSRPPRLAALDAETGELKRNLLTASTAPEGREWRSVHYQSSGNTTIQAWIATPEGDGPFPTILHTHGGPTSVVVDTFNPTAQAWVDHGFAYMSINYRGSVTFGSEFQHAIIGFPGHREIDDMVAGYQWLVDNNIAIPEKVFLMGGSYGGYLNLQAMSKRPDLWAGAMPSIAIADWTTLYDDSSDMLRGYHHTLFGGPPEEFPEQHRNSSPINFAENVEAPIFILQATNDSRCPPRQMRLYEAKMRELGKDITVHWFEAGHGSRKTEEQIEHMELRLKWLYDKFGAQ